MRVSWSREGREGPGTPWAGADCQGARQQGEQGKQGGHGARMEWGNGAREQGGNCAREQGVQADSLASPLSLGDKCTMLREAFQKKRLFLDIWGRSHIMSATEGGGSLDIFNI